MILTSVAFILYVPARMEFKSQHLKEKFDKLSPEKLEELSEKYPQFIKELEEE